MGQIRRKICRFRYKMENIISLILILLNIIILIWFLIEEKKINLWKI